MSLVMEDTSSLVVELVLSDATLSGDSYDDKMEGRGRRFYPPITLETRFASAAAQGLLIACLLAVI